MHPLRGAARRALSGGPRRALVPQSPAPAVARAATAPLSPAAAPAARAADAAPSASGAPLPPALSLARPANALARRDAVAALAVPRGEEEPILGVVRSWLVFACAAGLAAAALALAVASARSNPAAEADLMAAAVRELRRARAAGVAALLAAAPDRGVVVPAAPRAGGGAGGAPRRRARWWATGPRDARTVVLLVAEEGETAGEWGGVHAALAAALGASARVVSCDRDPPAAPPAPGAPPPRALTLGVADIDDVLAAATDSGYGGGRSGGGGDGSGGGGWGEWWQRRSARAPDVAPDAAADAGADGASLAAPRPPPGVLIVAAGAGAWAALAWAGLRPSATLGVVAVCPALSPRGRAGAWADALPAASAAPPGPDPRALVRSLLAPPPLPPAEAAAVAARIDANAPRAAAVARFYAAVGAAPFDAALAERAAEAARRDAARGLLLRSTDVALLEAASPAAAAALPPRALRALLPAPGALPRWLSPAGALAWTHAALHAAHAAGGFAADAAARAAVGAERAEVAPLVARELTGDEAGARFSGDTDERKHTRHALARLPFALGARPPPPPAEALALLAPQRELRLLPRAFGVTLVGARGRGEPGDGGGAAAGIVSLALQRPDAVAAEALSVLAAAGAARRGEGGGAEGRTYSWIE